jgi:predicted transposase YbfD/YdcC
MGMINYRSFEKCFMNCFEISEHGRQESRTCRVLSKDKVPSWGNTEDWAGLRSVVEIHAQRKVMASGQVQSETRYYISSLKTTAADFCQKIREHWLIENQLHWTMDVVMKEDASRKRSRNSAQNFALIRRTALNILKNHDEKISIKRKMNKCALSDDYRETLLTQKLATGKASP